MAANRELLFGTDLRLTEQAGGLDLAVVADGDLGQVEGADNILQALKLRLKVRRGELSLLGWPNFGSRLHELVGEPNTPRTRTVLMSHAHAAIIADPRVAKITRVESRVLPGERDAVRLELDLMLIDRQTPMNLVFDARLDRL